MQRTKRYPIVIVFLFICLPFFAQSSNGTSEKKMNVLFIAVDDLRLQAGIFGQDQMHTPALDKLGKEGLVFNKAYCSVPVCGASRASLLTGLRPTPNRFVNYHAKKDDETPDITSLPLCFKENGYTTISLGKVYHHAKDDLKAWSEEPWDAVAKNHTWRDYVLEENLKLQRNPEIKTGRAIECADVADNAYRDGKIAERAIQDLQEFKKSGEPFFLALGFLKPHLPFNAPKKYFDLYKDEDIELALHSEKPKNAPKESMHGWYELRNGYFDIPKEGPVSEKLAKELVHGYYACVSYTDAQIAKVLAELEKLGLDENTVVVLWGDHGWHLGEHGLWCKHCNFDKVMKAPLIIKAPGKAQNAKTSTLVEFIDIYPTLCDLADLDKPKHLDGKSLLPVLNNPEKTHKKAAFCRYHNGESVITNEFVYTKWIKNGEFVSHMLYDHKNDPAENINVADLPKYKEVVKKMNLLLQEKDNSLLE